MKITIKVTKEIIKKAMFCGVPWYEEILEKRGIDAPSIAENCAIALAVREIFPDAGVVNDDECKSHFIRVARDISVYYIEVPQIATNFIRDFDRKAKDHRSRLLMNSVSFEVEMPDELVNEIGIGEIYKVLSESRTLELTM